MPIRCRFFLVSLGMLPSTFFLTFLLAAETPESAKTIHDRISGMKTTDGLFPTALDTKTGHLFLTVHNFDKDFLFVVSLPYGLGSNDIGLDRGRMGHEQIVHFARVGPRVLLV